MTPPDARETWFVYARSAGRITGAPANWRGWAALLAALAATIGLALALGRPAAEVHPALGFVALATVLATGITLIVRLVIVKGRRVDR